MNSQLRTERSAQVSDSLTQSTRVFRQRTAISIGLLVAVATLMNNQIATAQVKPAARDIQFNRDIRPLLSDRCFYCHGPDSKHREADLRLDQQATAHGSAIIPGNPRASELISRITSKDPDIRMPPTDSGKTLSAGEIDLLRRWIDAGAEYQSHWSFLPPKRVTLESPPESDWASNPIDHFVLRRLDEKGLQPSPRAAKETLIRRVTLDLTGLPPTPQEVSEFLSDESDTAYEKVVDRLLNSERYGERMAQQWLDAARYADTMGYQADWERYQWRWRTWVIDAYNRNLPFDQFTIEQLAGDLLPNPSTEQMIATGFNRNHRINDEAGIIPQEYLVEYIVDRVETTSATWMGLTMGCARCHDHKFDPFSQADFYQMFAFFNGVPEQGKQGRKGYADPYMRVAVRGRQAEYETIQSKLATEETRVAQLTRNFRKERTEWEEQLHEELVDATSTAESPNDTSVPAGDQGNTEASSPDQVKKSAAKGAADSPNLLSEKLPKDVVTALKKPAAKRTAAEKKRLAEYFLSVTPETRKAWQALARTRKEASDFESAHTTYVMVMREMDKPRPTHILNRGVYNQPGQPVTAAVPDRILGPMAEGTPRNRLGFAKWLVSGRHPLTARVVVNRYWAMLFGSGLVTTLEDFGLQGEYPSHPELLDWLATEYPRNGWDTKALLKLIVTSSTYQQSSVTTAEAREQDPKNRLLSRMSRVRLPAEMIRDQALAASGLLVQHLGGPSVKPYQPAGLWSDLSFNDKRRSTDFYVQDEGDGLYRRSLYTFWKRSVPPPSMSTFDAPSREFCVLSRSRTNTPLQALALMNDTTYVEAARVLATHSQRKHPKSVQDQLRYAFRSLLAREPEGWELRILSDGVARRASYFNSHKEDAEKLIAQGSSIPADTDDAVALAALTTGVMNILNLDETINRE